MRNIFLKSLLMAVGMLSFFSASSQVTVRYQQNIQGGATMVGNSWYYSTTVPGQGDLSGMKKGNADASLATTIISSSSDLILPAGSTIVKAYLSVERNTAGSAGAQPLTSVDIKVPGSSTYTTLTSAARLSSKTINDNAISFYFYYQDIFDITSLVSPTTYGTTVAGSSAGRFYVAKPTPDPLQMGGWSIIVVYTNPLSKFRSVTVADNWQVFRPGTGGTTTINTDVTSVVVPSAGTVKAIVGVTGTYGDRGSNFTDALSFGNPTGTLTALSDPTTGVTNDALNSSVGIAATNNVSADGGPARSGNVTTRNPISAGHPYGNSRASESWEYDSDIFDASNILTASSTPVDVRFQQQSFGSDVLTSGSYFISVDLASSAQLSKFVSPASISDGGVATYTWTINNTSADAVTLSGLGFIDNLPTSIKVAATPNATITGGSGGTVSATPGSGTVTVSGLTLTPGQFATIKVDITNVAGQLNASCGSNPAAFTNSSLNITPMGIVSASGILPQCLLVTSAAPPAAGTIDCAKTQIFPAPVQGTASQLDLMVTVNVTALGTFTPTVSGSGMSLANAGFTITPTATGTQTFHIPIKYDGTTLGTMTFGVAPATPTCTADLTKTPKGVITNIWTLDCVPTVGPTFK